MRFEIAIGKYRRALRWQNKEMSWEAFAKRCSKTHRTHETIQEYLSLKPDRQAEIKDRGGFFAGRLTNGRRGKNNVENRCFICLDADFAKPGFWRRFERLYDCKALMYSTHKHTDEKPRLRLIIPTSRPMEREEFEPISRKIAETLGIENFDHTTHQLARLMYWPSTSVDGEFVYEEQDGDLLDPEYILGKYRDWRDISSWPVSSRENKDLARRAAKAGDPLEKKGIVGAFCRTYFPIDSAISEFLEDVYEPAAVEGRYTYLHGESGAGLAPYDQGRFTYSFQESDPVSDKLCNAFDLVRIHMFGDLDVGKDENTPVNKLPSYLAMEEFAMEQKEVKRTLRREKLEELQDDFGDDGFEFDDAEDREPVDVEGAAGPEGSAEEFEIEEEWQDKLTTDKKGNILQTINNGILVMENDRKLKGRYAYDEFEESGVVLRNLPWRKVTPENRNITDVDTERLKAYIEKRYGLSTENKIASAVENVIDRARFHPVREYLSGLVWDGEARLDMLLCDYMGAEDCEYTRAVSRKTFVAAVARIFRPGIKFDYVLTLIGPQGAGKSTLPAKMAGEWFSDSFPNLNDQKEAMSQIQGSWIIEIGELAGLRKASVETIKHFVRKQVDKFRKAYGKKNGKYYRQCIFIATTNTRQFLTDQTGNRCFWPVDVFPENIVKNIHELSENERKQLWAEAVHYFNKGEKLYLPHDIEEEAYRIQEDHMFEDEWFDIIQDYLDSPAADENEWTDDTEKVLMRVNATDLFEKAIGGNKKDFNTFNIGRIHDIMSKMPGWSKPKNKIRFRERGMMRGYVRSYEDSLRVQKLWKQKKYLG